MKISKPLLAYRPPDSAPPPVPEEFSRTVEGWEFTRPPDTWFTPSAHPDYWTAHLAHLAHLVYRPEAEVRSGLLPPDRTHFTWFDKGSTQAVGYLHENHACLVFRGTEMSRQLLVDWKVNLTCVLYGSPGRHLGFHRAWRAVRQPVEQWLDSLPPHSGLCIAGHSLGGALAIVSAMELHGASRTVACVRTFGCPRVGSIEFALIYNRAGLGAVTRQFKYGTDAVTIIPPIPFFVPVTLAHKVQAPELPQAFPGLNPLQGAQPKPLTAVIGEGVDSLIGYMLGSVGIGIHARSNRRTQEALGVLLGVLTLLIFYANLPGYLLSHGRAWAASVGHTRTSALILAAVAILLVEQLSYLAPLRIHSALRWMLAVAAIVIPASLHLPLLRIVPMVVVTVTYTFIGAVILLRLLEPSTQDHTMDGYLLWLPIKESNYARRRTASAEELVRLRQIGMPLD